MLFLVRHQQVRTTQLRVPRGNHSNFQGHSEHHWRPIGQVIGILGGWKKSLLVIEMD